MSVGPVGHGPQDLAGPGGASTRLAAATLLLLDLVDSTRLAERLGDEGMAAFWFAHDRLARDLLEAARGREIDKSDGFLLLFESPGDAVQFAFAYHRALPGLHPAASARAGIHVGPVSLRRNADADVARGAKPVEADGLAKPIAARVMSVAGPGQTMLTAEAAKGATGAGVRVRSAGHWRLQGLKRPIRLFEAVSGHAPLVRAVDSPKGLRVVRRRGLWLPVKRIRHSLPAEADAFIGRTTQLEHIVELLSSRHRFVCLVGTGGAGKTRTATRAGWALLGDFPGGVWFCDLSSARSLEDVARAVARGMDLPLGRTEPIAQVARAMSGRGRALYVLDNFEQVTSWADATLGAWLRGTSDACFIVTSREQLRLPGERVVELDSLQPGDARALFVDRARASCAGFEPSPADEAAIDALVRMLDGLPLAIELAAARVSILSPQALLQRIAERFKLLVAPRGRRPRRHETLRATFEWSWELLSEVERSAFAQLSVFEGGMDIAAAEAVLDLSGFTPVAWPLDILQSLVEKSLLRRSRQRRFELLSTAREFAAEQLVTPDRFAGSGPDAERLAFVRYVAFFAGLSDADTIADRCADLDNLVLACRRAVALGDADAATRTLERAWHALRLRGPYRVGIDLAGAVLGMEGLRSPQRAHVECVEGESMSLCGMSAEAETRLNSAAQAGIAAADQRLASLAMCQLAILKINAGRLDESRVDSTAALQAARAVGDLLVECKACWALGDFHEHVGEMREAGVHYQQALVAARKLGDRRHEAGSLGNLGMLFDSMGRTPEAEHSYRETLAIASDIGDRQLEGNTRCNLGLLLISGDAAAARVELDQALAVARELGYPRLEGIVLANLALAHEALGEGRQARARYEAALAVIRQLGDPRYEGQVLASFALFLARQGEFDLSRECFAHGLDLLHHAGDTLSESLLLCHRSEAAVLAGDRVAAAASWHEARRLAGLAEAGDTSELGRALQKVEKMLAGSKAQAP